MDGWDLKREEEFFKLQLNLEITAEDFWEVCKILHLSEDKYFL